MARNPEARIGTVSHQTLSSQIYNRLRESIMSGQLQPGERLTLAGLARALGTSAMPVREALNRLAAEEALELLPNKSVRVPVMTREQFGELVVIRIAVEGLAMELAAVRIGAPELKRLALLDAQFSAELARPQPNVNKLIALNKQFHFGAYGACAMPTLCALIEGLWLRIGPVLNLDLRSRAGRGANPPAVKAHQAMLDALKAADPQAAKAALALDIRSAADSILAGGGLR